MRRIVTAISAAALSLSLVSMAMPANAAAGFDSAYAGESAFLTLNPGQSGTFTVFFANTGTSSWVKGTSTQVDLAACLEDKVTCNAQDAAEAGFNSGWLSSTRYATHTQTTVAPGSIGTFTYNVAVASTEAAALHRFNGALVVAVTGADVHNEGYYQDVNVAAPSGAAATLISISPIKGAIEGGTTVTISGTGFVCTPAFPTVTFDTSAASVTACGASTLTAKTPAHAAGTVNVTVTNTGAPASNALLFTYADVTAPTYTAVAATAGTVAAKLSMSESVCNTVVFDAADFAVTVNGGARAVSAARTTTGTNLFTTVVCTGAAGASSTSGFSSFQIAFAAPVLVAGDFVTVTITAAGAAKIQDVSGNTMAGAQTQTTNAAADTSAPTISSAEARSDTTIRLTYNEAVICGTGNVAGGLADFLNQFTATVGGSSLKPTAATCPGDPTLGATRITLTFGSSIAAGGSVSYEQSSTSANRVKDLAGNNATSPQAVAFAAFTADTTPPTITAAAVTANTGSTNFGDIGDKFTLTFSETMGTSTAAVKITVTDSDPGATKGLFTFDCAAASEGMVISCSWDTTAKVLTVAVTTAITPAANAAQGTTAGLQLPLTITATTGLADEAGNAPNLSASDKVID